MIGSTADRTGGRTDRRPRRRALLLGTAGTAVLVAVWFAAAAVQPEVLVPSPAETLRALGRIAERGELTRELAITGVRAGIGVLIALVAGVVWGLGAAASGTADELTRPLRAVLLGVPPVVPIVLGSVWLGVGGPVAVLVVVLITLPTVAVTVAEGARDLDRGLLEMARVHEVPFAERMRHVVLPALAPSLRAAWSLACAAGLRVTIVVELFAASDGVGAAVALARARLETADVFAWALVAIVAALVLDRLVGHRWTTRRRNTGSRARNGNETVAIWRV